MNQRTPKTIRIHAPEPIRKKIAPLHSVAVETGDSYHHADITLPPQNAMTGGWNFREEKDGSLTPVRNTRLQGIAFDNVTFAGTGQTWWANRLYEIAGGLTYRRCQFQKVGVHPLPSPGAKEEGHGAYLNAISGAYIMFSDTQWHNLKGNCVQIVSRRKETAFKDEWDKELAGRDGKIGIYRPKVLDACQGDERGSFPFALYSGHSVEMIAPLIYYSNRFPKFVHNGNAYQSKGGILVGDGQETQQRTKQVHISGGLIMQRNPLQPALQFQGVDDIQIKNLQLSKGVYKIVIDDDCKSAHIHVVPANGAEVRVIQRLKGKYTEILRSKKEFTYVQ